MKKLLSIASAIWLAFMFVTLCFSGTAAANVSIEGKVSFSIQGGYADISIERISNYSTTRTTGTLYVKLWATSTPQAVGSGFELVSVNLSVLGETGQLQPRSSWSGISLKNHKVDQPPAGTYFMHVIVTEYPNVNTIIDSITFDQTTTFTNPILPGGPGGASDGAGGSFDLLSVLIAIIILVRSRYTKRFNRFRYIERI